MKKIIQEGEMIPKGYGVAWRDSNFYGVICYPIPLNVVYAFFRKVWVWLRWGHRLYDDGYSQGYRHGKGEGREYAFNQYKKQVLVQLMEKIIKDYQDRKFEITEKLRAGENIEGWIYEFMDQEKKKLNNVL